MGYAEDGVWNSGWYDTKASGGRFLRSNAQFRNWITPDGAPGPSGEGGFAAEAGRYHLYVSLACPWAHRTLIYRVLKGLTGQISVSVTNWVMAEAGWTFAPAEGVVPDPQGASTVFDVYRRAVPRYSGRVTVPVLWDKRRETIVNNESSEIIRMLGGAFDGVGARPGDYYPPALREEIDALNARIYDTVNNGVYKAGFATTQAAYEEAVFPLFETLDWLEARLTTRGFLCGEKVTEADWRLLTTLLRFDAVYVGHFKCNLRRLVDYPQLWDYTRALYQTPGVAETVNFRHIKGHYYQSHGTINPTGIVPAGPQLDFSSPTARRSPLT
jgi:putative glutathione S-transferase